MNNINELEERIKRIEEEWIYVKTLDTLKLIYFVLRNVHFGVFHIPSSPSK